MSSNKESKQHVVGIALAVALACGLAPLVAPELLLSRFFDDAFYYYTIARNVAAGRGFTFDGIHVTNGFHPLWLFLSVPVFRFVPGLFAPLRVMMLIQGLLVAAGCIGIYRVLAPRIGARAAFIAALSILALPGSLLTFQSGMEAALLFALWVLLWRAWVEDASALRVGVICAALAMTRLEMILVVPVLVALRWRTLLSDRRSLVMLCAPPTIVFLIYALWSRSAFGVWMPVSGMTKRAITGRVSDDLWMIFPWVGQALLHRVLTGSILIPSWSTLLIVVAICVWQRRRLAMWFQGAGAQMLLLTSLVVHVADKLSVKLLFNWYEVPIFLATALIIGVFVARAPRIYSLALSTLIVASLARYAAKPFFQRELADIENTYILRSTQWLKAHVGRDERIGSWNAGAFGYLSGLHVVNLDGLVNDREYYRRVVIGGEWESYLRDERIDWIVDGGWIETAKAEDCATEINCERLQDFEVVQRFAPADGDQLVGQSIWKRRHR